MSAKRPGPEYSNKTNINPVVNRLTEATAEDYQESADILNNHADLIDQLLGDLYNANFVGYFGSLATLKAAVPNPDPNDFAIIISSTGDPDNIAKVVNGQWEAQTIPQDIQKFNTRLDFPPTGDEKVWYIAKDSRRTYLWYDSKYNLISGSTSGVTYTPQTPTPTQQAQARENIGLATVLANYIETVKLGAAGGVAQLGADQKLLPGQVPDLAITSVKKATETTLADFAANSANYTFEEGDVIVIVSTTGSKSHYMFSGGLKTDTANYSQITAEEFLISQVQGLQAILDAKLEAETDTLQSVAYRGNETYVDLITKKSTMYPDLKAVYSYDGFRVYTPFGFFTIKTFEDRFLFQTPDLGGAGNVNVLILYSVTKGQEATSLVARFTGRLGISDAQNQDEAASFGQTLETIKISKENNILIAQNVKGDEMSRADLSFIPELQPFEITDKYTYASGAKIFPLEFEVEELHAVFLNGTRLSRNQYKYTYRQIEILIAMTTNDKVVVQYTTASDMSQAYGIKRDKTNASPDWERIGKDMTLHASLPVQSKLRRCILKDDGTVNYYLKSDDSTKKEDGTNADLSGTDGQFMEEIPRHFQRFDEEGNHQYTWISLVPFPGCFEIPKQYVSAGKANLDRAANKLACVLNFSANYRGGDSQSAWDADTTKRMLGKPVTNKSRTEFKTAAQNRGEGWDMMNYEVRRIIYWLITVEYATSYHQKSTDLTLTPEGYKKGGLDNGPTIIDSAEWSNYNGYYPLAPIGLTDNFGNNTDGIVLQLQDFPSTGEVRYLPCISYRGIENFFGDLWEWTDGINVDRQTTQIKAYKSIGDAHSDTDFAGYKPMPNLPNDKGYITDIVFGKRGDILPTSSAGGSATTYFTDYFYLSASEGVRGLLFGGSANHGARAGSLFALSNNAPSYAAASIGSRLCFLAR